MFCPYPTFSFKDTGNKSDSQGSQRVVEEPVSIDTSEMIQVRDTAFLGLRDRVGPGASRDTVSLLCYDHH